MTEVITFDPVADYKRGMEAELSEWQAKIERIRLDKVFGNPYKEFAIAQLEKDIANRQQEIIGFDNLTHPIKY